MENYRCNDCGLVCNDDELKSDMLLCPSCGGHLEEGSFQKTERPKSKPASEYQKEESNSHKKSEYSQQNQEYFTFSCLSCGKSLRVAFPFLALTFRCGSCSGVYDILSVNSRRQIYLVVPKLSHKASNPPPRPPAMPEEVRRALRVFDFKEGISWEDVKAKYRKCMSEYHPDKVTHLGADLRKLAEEKTKLYNAAYNDIQRYFEKVDKH